MYSIQHSMPYQLLADSPPVRDLTLDGLHSTQQALLLLLLLLLLQPLLVLLLLLLLLVAALADGHGHLQAMSARCACIPVLCKLSIQVQVWQHELQLRNLLPTIQCCLGNSGLVEDFVAASLALPTAARQGRNHGNLLSCWPQKFDHQHAKRQTQS
jgi:hypothetical protein